MLRLGKGLRWCIPFSIRAWGYKKVNSHFNPLFWETTDMQKVVTYFTCKLFRRQKPDTFIQSNFLQGFWVHWTKNPNSFKKC